MTHKSRLAYLLGEMRREMNGAVVGSMRFYGDDYGLNYGVSIPTIRSVAQHEAGEESDVEINHRFAKQLYAQEVRELRLGAFWFASAADVELDRWSAGVINSEVAEEAAFALMHKVSQIDKWLDEESELLQYCALLSIAKQFANTTRPLDSHSLDKLWSRVVARLSDSTKLLPKSVVALLDTMLKVGAEPSTIAKKVEELPAGNASTQYITEEMEWRLDLYAPSMD